MNNVVKKNRAEVDSWLFIKIDVTYCNVAIDAVVVRRCATAHRVGGDAFFPIQVHGDSGPDDDGNVQKQARSTVHRQPRYVIEILL